MTPVDPPSSKPHSWTQPLILAAMIFCVYFFLSTRSTIWDRDEARFSRATAEMAATGNLLYPTFLGELRPDKPILIYWLMVIPVKIFGHVEWAYRIVSVLGTTLACLFTYRIGRELFGHTAGLWAMVILAANPLMAMDGAAGTTDSVLLAEMTLMFLICAQSITNKGFCVRQLIALALVVAAGVLTKGPVAILPLVSYAITRAMLRKELGSPQKDLLGMLAALLAGAAIFAAWFIPADQATHGLYYDLAFGKHVLKRISTPMENHGGYSPIYLAFYFIVILAAFFPWTYYLPAALARLKANAYGGRVGKIFLLSWFLTILGVMIAISTKLPHYVLPAWPAMSLMVGCAIQEYAAIPVYDASDDLQPNAPASWWIVVGGIVFLLSSLALGGGLAYGLTFLSQREPAWAAFAASTRTECSVIGALVLIVCVLVGSMMKARQVACNGRILAGAVLVFFVLAGTVMVPAFESLKVSDKVAALVRKNSQSEAPVLLTSFNEASLIFYLDKHPLILELNAEKDEVRAAMAKSPPVNQPSLKKGELARLISAEALAIWAGKRSPGVLVIPASEYEVYKGLASLPEMQTLGNVSGFNYSKGKWVDLLVLKRME